MMLCGTFIFSRFYSFICCCDVGIFKTRSGAFLKGENVSEWEILEFLRKKTTLLVLFLTVLWKKSKFIKADISVAQSTYFLCLS